MPLHLPFNFPYFYNNYRYPKYLSRHNGPTPHYNSNIQNENNINSNNLNNSNTNSNNINNNNLNNSNLNSNNINSTTNYSRIDKKAEQKNAEDSEALRSSTESSEYFFEIFGLKIHFDDILIICILFFLYKEEVHDEELFLCLILLLIS